MRWLVLTDIHGNIEALDAILVAVPLGTYDQLLVLGDLVGYGASPNEVVDRLYELEPNSLIRGNHDKVASGIHTTRHFNRLAAQAAMWTLKTLTVKNRERIANLPSGPCIIDRQIEICHGTPFDEDVYVFNELDAKRALEASQQQICFFGHTHVPVVFESTEGSLQALILAPNPEGITTVAIHKNCKYLINPGSVGQPRDGDPRAAYAIFDSKKSQVALYRIDYPVNLAQQKIIESGLPEHLAHRLALGL